MDDSRLKTLMPPFRRSCRDTNEFGQFIKGKLRSYQLCMGGEGRARR